MGSLLDIVTIKFELKMKGDFLAKVTLNWQDEFEVRFCRLTLRPDNTLWFQPPALKDYGWAKCFAVLDANNWKRLEQNVIEAFIQEFEKKVSEGEVDPSFLEKLKSNKKEEVTEEDWNKIDKEINNDTDTHL